MKIHNLVHPIYDETFPSWMTRCALNPKILAISERAIVFWGACDLRNQFSDPLRLGMEFDFHQSQGIIIANDLGVDTKSLLSFFGASSDFLLAPEIRTAYCHLCIHSDVVSKRFPSWRKSWCYFTNPYCAEHKCLLSHIDSCPAVEKQWQAFVRGNLGDYVPGRPRRRLNRLPANFSRSWLTLRVQTWIQRLHRHNLCALPGTNILVDARELIQAVNLVLRMLLVPRTDRTPPGEGRIYFNSQPSRIVHKILNLDQRLECGAPNSVPYECMSALLLLGLIFKVFTKSEISLLNKLIVQSEFGFPSNLIDLGSTCKSHVSFSENERLNNLFTFSDEIMEFLGGFLQGLLTP